MGTVEDEKDAATIYDYNAILYHGLRVTFILSNHSDRPRLTFPILGKNSAQYSYALSKFYERVKFDTTLFHLYGLKEKI